MAEAVTIDVDTGIDTEEIERALDNGRKRIEDEARGRLAHLSWPMVRKRLAVAIDDELGKDMLPWIASAWQTFADLQKFKDEEKYPPGRDYFYDLFPQSIEGAIQPKVTVSCEGQTLAELPFDVKVKVAFHCGALVIRNAEIVGVGGGDYKVTLDIALYGQDLGGPIELHKSRLPVEFTFARGLPII
jgi:hypothetical protein